MPHSCLPFCWEATKLRIISMASWWAFLSWIRASSSTASYVSLSAKSFKLYRADDWGGPTHLSTNSCNFSNPWAKHPLYHFLGHRQHKFLKFMKFRQKNSVAYEENCEKLVTFHKREGLKVRTIPPLNTYSTTQEKDMIKTVLESRKKDIIVLII